MDLRKLQRVVVDALDDIKGQDIRVFNTSRQTAEFDRVVIATGQSNRQTRALADHVCDKVREACGQVVSREGGETGEWVLVDLGDIVVHVMQPEIRAYYNLEEIWGAVPVRLRVGPETAGKAASAPSKAATTGARKAALATGKAAPAKPGAKKPASRKSAAKPGAKKPVARKSAAKQPGTKKPAAGRTTARKAPAGKPATGAKRDASGSAARSPAASAPRARSRTTRS